MEAKTLDVENVLHDNDFGRDLTDLDLTEEEEDELTRAHTDDEQGDDLSDEHLLHTDDDERQEFDEDDELQTDDDAADDDADNRLSHIQLDNDRRGEGPVGPADQFPSVPNRRQESPPSARLASRRLPDRPRSESDDEFAEMGFEKETYYKKKKIPRRDLKKLLVAERKAREAVLQTEAVNLAIHDEKAADLFSFRSLNSNRHRAVASESSDEVRRWMSGQGMTLAPARSGYSRNQLLGRSGSFLNQKPEEVQRLMASSASRPSSLQSAFVFDTRRPLETSRSSDKENVPRRKSSPNTG